MYSIEQLARRLLTRCHLIASGLLGAITFGALAGCGGGSSAASTTSTSTGSTGSTGSNGTTASSGSCTIIPSETQGTYPLYSSVVSNSALRRQDVTQAVYASTLYAAHGQNTSVASFAQDGVFSDGTTYQMVSIAGGVDAGYVASITAGIAV